MEKKESIFKSFTGKVITGVTVTLVSTFLLGKLTI